MKKMRPDLLGKAIRPRIVTTERLSVSRERGLIIALLEKAPIAGALEVGGVSKRRGDGVYRRRERARCASDRDSRNLSWWTGTDGAGLARIIHDV
jgi:hypothetical protein